MPKWTTQTIFELKETNLSQAILLLSIILISIAIKLLVTKIVGLKLQKLLTKFSPKWGHELPSSAAIPLGYLAMATSLVLMVPIVNMNIYLTKIAMIASQTIVAASFIVLTYRSIDIFTEWLIIKNKKKGTKLDEQLTPLVNKGLKIATIIVGLIFILQNLNVNVTSLLAGVTVGGLAFTLAAKDTVSNLFGSVTIFIDKPFSIGDWVKTAGAEGIVESIGFRSTRVRTFYNSLVTVPNNKFIESIVDNLGARIYRRCNTKIEIKNDTEPEKIEKLCEEIRKIIKVHEKTRKECCEVHVSGFRSYYIEIMIYFFTVAPSWTEELESRHEIFLKILKLSKSLNIEFAPPFKIVRIENMDTKQQKNKGQSCEFHIENAKRKID